MNGCTPFDMVIRWLFSQAQTHIRVKINKHRAGQDKDKHKSMQKKKKTF